MGNCLTRGKVVSVEPSHASVTVTVTARLSPTPNESREVSRSVEAKAQKSAENEKDRADQKDPPQAQTAFVKEVPKAAEQDSPAKPRLLGQMKSEDHMRKSVEFKEAVKLEEPIKRQPTNEGPLQPALKKTVHVAPQADVDKVQKNSNDDDGKVPKTASTGGENNEGDEDDDEFDEFGVGKEADKKPIDKEQKFKKHKNSIIMMRKDPNKKLIRSNSDLSIDETSSKSSKASSKEEKNEQEKEDGDKSSSHSSSGSEDGHSPRISGHMFVPNSIVISTDDQNMCRSDVNFAIESNIANELQSIDEKTKKKGMQNKLLGRLAKEEMIEKTILAREVTADIAIAEQEMIRNTLMRSPRPYDEPPTIPIGSSINLARTFTKDELVQHMILPTDGDVSRSRVPSRRSSLHADDFGLKANPFIPKSRSFAMELHSNSTEIEVPFPKRRLSRFGALQVDSQLLQDIPVIAQSFPPGHAPASTSNFPQSRRASFVPVVPSPLIAVSLNSAIAEGIKEEKEDAKNDEQSNKDNHDDAHGSKSSLSSSSPSMSTFSDKEALDTASAP